MISDVLGCLARKAMKVPETWDNDVQVEQAESYIRDHKALHDHYNLQGVQDILQGKIGNQGKIANISNRQTQEIVERIRNEKGW